MEKWDLSKEIEHLKRQALVNYLRLREEGHSHSVTLAFVIEKTLNEVFGKMIKEIEPEDKK